MSSIIYFLLGDGSLYLAIILSFISVITFFTLKGILRNIISSVTAVIVVALIIFRFGSWATLISSNKGVINIVAAIDMEGDTFSIGKEQKIGLTIARNEFRSRLIASGVPMRITDRNTLGDPNEAAKLFNELTEDKERVAIIIGPSTSQQALKASPIADMARIPVLAPSNTITGLTTLTCGKHGKDYDRALGCSPGMKEFFPNRYISRISAPVERVAQRSVDRVFLLKRNKGEIIKKVVVAYAQDDAFCISEYESFQSAIRRKGIIEQNITIIPFNKSDNDFSSIIEGRIMKNDIPDLIIISGLGQGHWNFIKQLRNNLNNPKNNYLKTIIVGNGLNSPGIAEYCGNPCRDVFVSQAYDYSSTRTQNVDFKKAYANEERTGNIPSQFSAQMYTAVQVVIDSLVALSQEKSIKFMPIEKLRKELRDKLRSMPFDTILGEISIDENGEVRQNDSEIITLEISPKGEEWKIR